MEFVWHEGNVTDDVYPGVDHAYHLMVPELAPSHEVGVLVVLDGPLYLDEGGTVRGSSTLQTLMRKGLIPHLAVLFLAPGEPGMRNIQYDDSSDKFAGSVTRMTRSLLLRHGVLHEASGWGIAGGSSGGSGALNIAWHQHDVFSRVACFLGSFPQLGGGEAFPARLEAQSGRGLRVFQLVASGDLGAGQRDDNWFASGLEVAAALNRGGYSHRLVVGTGGHTPQETGEWFGETITWLWADHPIDNSDK